MSDKIKKKEKWYDSGFVISNLIILVIIITIVCSQSFAVSGSLAQFGSIINYNSIYLLVLVYFVCLKVKIGKKYFNYLNLFLIFVYFFVTITSLLTVIQSFGLKTLIDFILNLVLIIYLVHTMFRDTRIWKEFKLGNSPFNEISNDMYYYTLIVFALFNLAVKLISTVYFSGVVLAVIDLIYILLLGRYIYLYRDYLDFNKKDINNEGNFDELRENVQELTHNVTEKVSDTVEAVSNKVEEIVDKKEDNIDSKKIDTKKKGEK